MDWQESVLAGTSGTVISVRKSEVPAYLQTGDFFLALHSGNDAEMIEVPDNVVKAATSVNSYADLAHLLNSLRFWMVSEPVPDIIGYVLSNNQQDSVLDVISPFEQNFPYLSDLRVLKIDSKVHILTPLIDQAVKLGNVEIVRFLFEQGLRFSDKSLLLAAENGRLECLQFMIETGAKQTAPAFNTAIQFGRIDCVKYLHGVGKIASNTTTAMKAACLFNQLEILTFLHEAGYPWHRHCLNAAAETGSLECLQYAVSHSDLPLIPPVINTAAKEGHVDVVKYLLQQNCPSDESLLMYAIEGGHLSVLTLLHKAGFELNSNVFDAAVVFGQVEILRYLHSHHCPWDASAMDGAVTHDQVSCVEYLREIGCAWSADTMCLAVYNSNVDMVRYLHAHGCPWSIECYKVAIQRNYSDMLAFLHDHTGDEMISFAQFSQKMK